MFPELHAGQERKLRTRKRREEPLNAELTERELDMLGLREGGLSTRQMGLSLYAAPSTVRTHENPRKICLPQARGLLAQKSCGAGPREGNHLASPHKPENLPRGDAPAGEADCPAVPYA